MSGDGDLQKLRGVQKRRAKRKVPRRSESVLPNRRAEGATHPAKSFCGSAFALRARATQTLDADAKAVPKRAPASRNQTRLKNARAPSRATKSRLWRSSTEALWPRLSASGKRPSRHAIVTCLAAEHALFFKCSQLLFDPKPRLSTSFGWEREELRPEMANDRQQRRSRVCAQKTEHLLLPLRAAALKSEQVLLRPSAGARVLLKALHSPLKVSVATMR